MLRDAERAGIAVEDLGRFTYAMAKPIAALARDLAPRGPTGNLKRSIRPSRSKKAVRVTSGTNSETARVQYAAVNHWGRDGHSGPKWLSVAEERLRPQTMRQFSEGIKKLLRDNGWSE